jgi:hypothetical protein
MLCVIFALALSPPSPFSTRSADPIQYPQTTFAARLKSFHEENDPLLAHYEGAVMKFEGKSSKEIWPKLEKAIEDRVSHLLCGYTLRSHIVSRKSDRLTTRFELVLLVPELEEAVKVYRRVS